MQIKILGSAAGGGFPQWNCHCAHCDGVRRGTVRAAPRTQSSIAVSTNGQDWLLVNASPDILRQIETHPELRPATALRGTALRAILAVDAQIDHVTGLMLLREHGAPLPLYATSQVLDELRAGLPIVPLLSHYCGVACQAIPADGSPFHIPMLPGAALRAVALSSNAPPYSPHRDMPVPGDNIGLLFENLATGRRAFYAPGLSKVDDAVRDALRQADLLLLDGTFWREDEMIRMGLSRKTAATMGHLPQSGPGGMIDILDSLKRPGIRKILVHINNSNPILIDDGPERRILTEHGIEVAYDGMALSL